MKTARSAIGELVRKTPLLWYFPNRVSRMETLQLVINGLSARRYLEIGVAHGDCFSSIKVKEKIGVDPREPAEAVRRILSEPGVSYFAEESDKFFEVHGPKVLAGGIDVAFVDGLHTYKQCHRDIMNCLQYLNPRGVVLVHDCRPRSAEEAQPASSYEQAREIIGSDYRGPWTGDVWKAIVRLRSERRDLNVNVLNTDQGIAVVWKGPSDPVINFSLAEIDKMTYADLSRDIEILLGMRSPNHMFGVLRRLERVAEASPPSR